MNTDYGKNIDFVRRLKEVTNKQFEIYNVRAGFPEALANMREEDIVVKECRHRKDFTKENVLTIDSEDCKDMDDAVSIVRTASGFRLSVHIADVASYVPLGSELDKIACNRATSIYLPHLTVPMLPQVLSNNCCSLNPRVNRSTLSVIINLNNEGRVMSSEITKGTICSRVKGVYSEINKLLAGIKDPALLEKYHEVYRDIFEMKELYKILRLERMRSGATIEDSNRPHILVAKHNIRIIPIKEGVAENMIEEFMILANRVIAEYLYDNNLPAIFRVQEEKNHMAAYQTVKNHHAELALESYAHFTSPIRRIADLKIHQVLTMHLDGCDSKEIHNMFDKCLFDVCDRATKRSRTAKQIQEKCERYCYEQFFLIHKKDKYTGQIVGFDCRNRPIVKVNRYNIKVIGYTIINGMIGDIYSFKVGFSHKNNELFTNGIHKLAA